MRCVVAGAEEAVFFGAPTGEADFEVVLEAVEGGEEFEDEGCSGACVSLLVSRWYLVLVCYLRLGSRCCRETRLTIIVDTRTSYHTVEMSA